MTPLAIVAFCLSTVISFFLYPPLILFFRHRGWVEDPKIKQKKSGNATATNVVPRGGGLPIFISVTIICLIFLPHDSHLWAIILASFLTLIVGIWDDLRDISPKLRLFFNIFSALIVVASGIGIAYLSNPFGGTIDLSYPRFSFELFNSIHSIWFLSDILAIFWIVWCSNFVGWASGVEGQLPGFVAISAFFIGFLGLKFSGDITQWPVIILSLAVAGAYLGFLPYNFFPQKIMPGYSGKSLAGFYLAVLSILSGAKLATLILLLGVPMIDALIVLFRRLKSRRSIFSPDANHLHHQLLKQGWGRRRIAITYWLFSFGLGFISLFLNSQQKFYTFIGIALIFIGLTLKFFRRI